MNQRENNSGRVLVKYFEHGIFFSIMMSGYLLFLPLVEWIVAYDFVPLTFEPLLILLLIIYIFLGIFLFVGKINAYINKSLWKINASYVWQDLLGDGAVLFALFCIIQLPAVLVTTLLAWMQPGGLFLGFWNAFLPIFVPSILITPVPNGIAGKHLAKIHSKTLRAIE